MRRRYLIVFHNLNYDTYYYKFTSMTYKRYSIGDVNQYNHEVILVIDKDEVQPYVVKQYFSIKSLVLTPIKKLLQGILGVIQKIDN